MKSKGQDKKNDIFREGESEEYNSEVDGELDFEDTGICYDIMNVKAGDNACHAPLLDLIARYEELPDDFEEALTYENKRKAL